MDGAGTGRLLHLRTWRGQARRLSIRNGNGDGAVCADRESGCAIVGGIPWLDAGTGALAGALRDRRSRAPRQLNHMAGCSLMA